MKPLKLLFFIAILFPLFSSGAKRIGATKVKSMQAEIDAVIQKEWSKTSVDSNRNVLIWNYRLSPPIPPTWPVTGKTKTVVFAFAAGIDTDLRDAEVIATQWGQVEYVKGDLKSLRFNRIATKISELGIQGVRTLSDEESKIPNYFDINTKQNFCLWFKLNSVITEELRKKDKGSFFKNIECE